MNTRFYYIGLLALLAIGCEEVIELDLPADNPRIVVDALITNQITSYYVRLSHTQKYSFTYDIDTQAYETGAIVIIHENNQVSDTLTEQTKGTYVSHQNKIVGTIGNSYSLEIITKNGKRYISYPEVMTNVAEINSIYFDRNKSHISSDNPEYYEYNVYIDWQDPPDEKNFYLRKFSYYWANKWHDNVYWNWVFHDKYFNGKIFTKDWILSEYGGTGFKVRVEQHALSKQAYDFWILVQKQTIQADNSLVNASTPIIGNIYNANDPNDYALGYFQVSAIDVAEVWINK